MNINDKVKILVIRMSSLGDIILTFPFIRLLRRKFPNSEIDFIVKSEFREVVESNKHISHIYSFDKNNGFGELKRIKSLIKQQKYNYVFDIHRNLRSYYLRMFSGAGRVFLYKKYRIRRFLLIYFKLNLYKTITPVYKAYINAGRKLGLVDDGKGFDFVIPTASLEKVDKLLEKRGINDAVFLAAICPGSGHRTKCWTEEGFIELSNFLISELNASIVIIGDTDDRPIGEAIKKSLGSGVFNFCGELSIMESAGLISKCGLVIANDAGPLHIAEALNKKVAALFGPTVEELGYFPVNTQSVVVQRMLRCRPCSNNGWRSCYKKTNECIERITPKDVMNACMGLLHNTSEVGQKEINI